MVKNNTIKGQCSNCGECCSEFLPMTLEEVERIRIYVKKHSIKNRQHIYDDGLHILCPFRNVKKKKCDIYPVRPSICRSFICSMLPKEIRQNKMDHIMRADYNNYSVSSMLSMHTLIFNDTHWEFLVLYNMLEPKDQEDFENKLRELNPGLLKYLEDV